MKGIINFISEFLEKPVGLFMIGRSASFFFIFFISILTYNDLSAQDDISAYDDISVLVQVEGYGSFYTSALYSDNGLLYVSIEDLFRYLKIPCIAGEKGDSLSGFLGNENHNYSISYRSATVKVGSKSTIVKKSLVKQLGSLFLESSLFGPLTGINLNFSFRSLSLTIKSDFELPAIKEQRLEKLRTNIRKNIGESPADTTLGRKYHLLKFGMADWSVMSSQFWGHQTETRLGLGMGTELLRGEANFFLNYSDKYKLDSRLQQYLWRWVDNDKKIVSQIQVGKIAPQTISSLYYPVIGAVISNVHTTIRKAVGEYILKEVTQPDWLVELYINNSLVDFTKADASGLFMFKVPMVYGYTTLMLRFYGPMGEERSETKTINVPYSFLPAGEVEYRISGGVLENGKKTPFGRGETTLGINRFLTLGMGVEYMASVGNKPYIPFVTASFMPISKMMVFGEYDHGVRLKGLLNYYPGANSILEIEYTKYSKNQQAILYNYLEERKASYSLPLKVKNISGFVRLGYKQNVYSNLNYNMTELLFSAYYKQFNANISSYANWVGGRSAYMNSMVALSYRLRKGLTIRSSAQFNISGAQILSYKTEVEKRFLHNGYISVSYENYTATRSSSVNFNFKYDLPFVQTNASARISNNEVSTFQNVRGSLAFGKGKKQILASELSNVGRGGISVIPFVDINHNGIYDKHEPKASNLRVRINGGRIIFNEKDTIINIIGLEPFISYNLELDDKDFENLSWRIREKSYKVLIDPNQLKVIYVPVIPVGEVSGTVNLKNDSDQSGLGRILVNFYNKSGVKVAQALTESDGYFDYLGLEPGKFTARIDSVQLSRLNFTSIPSEFSFKVENLESGDFVEGINFILNRNADQSINDSALIKKNIVNVVPVPAVIEKNLSDSIRNVVVKTDKTFDFKPVESNIDTINSKENPSSLEGHYYVQIGAFRSASKANNFESGLTGVINYPFGIVVEDGYYKVRIGYFRTTNEAELCKGALTKRNMISFIGQSFYFGYLKNQVFKYGAYYVGIGSFRYKQSAIQFTQKIKDRVPSALGIVQEDGLFKVRVGYFETKSEAKSCADKLNETGVKAIVGESKNFIYSGSLVPEI